MCPNHVCRFVGQAVFTGTRQPVSPRSVNAGYFRFVRRLPAGAFWPTLQFAQRQTMRPDKIRSAAVRWFRIPVTSRLISWRLRRFGTPISPISRHADGPSKTGPAR